MSYSSRTRDRYDAAAVRFLGGLQARTLSTSGDDAAFKLGRRETAQKRNPISRDGNSQIASSDPLMTNRIREGYLNIPIVKRATNLFRDLIVASGVQTFVDPFDWSFGFDLKRRDDDEFLHSLNVALELDEKFQRWADNPRFCDVAGKRCLLEIQRLTITEQAMTGDALVLLGKPADSSSPVPWALQLVEKEQVDVSRDRDYGPDADFGGIDTAIVNGFVVDRKGRELGVWLYDVHPYGHLSRNRESSLVRSGGYFHLFSSYRPSQHHGATWLHGLGQIAIDRDRWTEAELRKAIKQSLIALVHKSKTPHLPIFGIDDLENFADQLLDNAQEVRMGDSPLAQTIHEDEDLQLIESNAPNNHADKFVDMLDHDAASAVDLSYYSMTGQFGKTNYTGFRGASNLENAQIKPLQELFANYFIRPMRQRWNRDAVSFGHIEQLSAADLRGESERWARVVCIGGGRHLIDPDKETEASISQMRSGLSNLMIEAAKQSKHWVHLLRGIAITNRVLDSLDLVLDFGKGNGGNAETTTTSKKKETANGGSKE